MTDHPTDPSTAPLPTDDRTDQTMINEQTSVLAPTPTGLTEVELVIPVFNEQSDLGPSVRRLHRYLTEQLPYAFVITIADNASTDRTWEIAQDLAIELVEVRAVHLDQKGRGRALHQVWSASQATVCAYMDVDLSTDLNALLPLVAPLISGHSDLAIGTRLSRSSRVVRGAKRELISRSYNLLLRGALSVSFSDAQCGFKAIRTEAARRLLPLVEDTGWFFDTELLVLAQRAGLRIHEVPVDWIDDPDSRVDIVSTATADLHGIARLLRGFATGRIAVAQIGAELGRSPVRPGAAPVPGVPSGLFGQLLRFGTIGVLSTLAYVVLYLGLRVVAGAQVANLTALVITAVANTAANRRVTFGVVGGRDALRHHAGGFAAFLVGLGLTSGSLALLHGLVPGPHRAVEIAVLVVANACATTFRFLVLRQLVGRRTTVPAERRLATAGD